MVNDRIDIVVAIIRLNEEEKKMRDEIQNAKNEIVYYENEIKNIKKRLSGIATTRDVLLGIYYEEQNGEGKNVDVENTNIDELIYA